MAFRARYLTLAAPAVLVAAAIGMPQAAAGPRVGDFTADLAPVNQDGTGTATISQVGTNLTVHLQADGLDDGVHVAHIHGVRLVPNGCPTPGDDADGNGLVDIAEGLPSYGPVQVTISQGTNDRGPSLEYTRSFKLRDSGEAVASLGDLDRYAVVVHGVDLDGDGSATNPDAAGDGNDPDDNEISMPALCGEIERDG